MLSLTLMTPEAFHLTPALVMEIAARAGAGNPCWLQEGRACDLHVEGALNDVKRWIAEAIGDLPIDYCVQPQAGRRKQLLISDMDSTLIGQECIDELADKVGKKAEVSAITERAMRGEIAFEEALSYRVSLLRGLSEAVLEQVFAERITFTPGAAELARVMRAQGALTFVVSGGFRFFTRRVREALGFAEDLANELEVQDGTLTGKVVPPILGAQAKLHALQQACIRLGISPHEAMAVGDGANDLPMIRHAGMGVAFRAKPLVRAEADMALAHCDLSALLFVQGYNSEEISLLLKG